MLDLPSTPPADTLPNERRFVLQREQARALIKEMAARVSLEVYDHERPLAFTRTTYLDTLTNAYLRSCENGPVAKRLRIREYAAAKPGSAPVLTGRCFLELKVSRGSHRHKTRFEAPPHVIRELVDSRGRSPEPWVKRLEATPDLAALLTHIQTNSVSPRMTTWYHRASLCGDSGRVRVTIDESIQFCRAATPGHEGEPATPGERVGVGPGRIVEVKYAGTLPRWLHEALAPLPEANGLSKFRLGMRALRDAGRSSGWRTTDLLAVPGYLVARADRGEP